jgi:Tol biopolymer transport system component
MKRWLVIGAVTVGGLVVLILVVSWLESFNYDKYDKATVISGQELGGTLAYVASGDGSSEELYVLTADSRPRRLTVDNREDAHPVISPDGRRVAFWKLAERRGLWDVYAVKVDGSELTKLTEQPLKDPELVWSLDSTALRWGEAVHHFAGAPDPASIRWPGAQRVFVESHELYVRDENGPRSLGILGNSPAASPNGEWVAFQKVTPETNVITITSVPAHVTVISGTYTGVRTRTTIYTHGIWLIRTDGSGLRQVWLSGEESFNPAYPILWSTDSSRFAFNGHRHVYVATLDNGQVTRVSPGSDGLKIYAPCACGGDDPIWSPDGRQIAFVSTREGGTWIYIVNADGSNLRRLGKDAGLKQHDPAWVSMP